MNAFATMASKKSATNVKISTNVCQTHVTQMRTVLTMMAGLFANVELDTVVTASNVQTSTNVRVTPATKTQLVSIVMVASNVLAMLDSKEMARSAPTSTNVKQSRAQITLFAQTLSGLSHASANQDSPEMDMTRARTLMNACSNVSTPVPVIQNVSIAWVRTHANVTAASSRQHLTFAPTLTNVLWRSTPVLI